MMKTKPRILVLSSVSPSVGPAIIGEQIYEALKRKGLDVDFMTKYPEPNHPEYLWVVKRENFFKKILLKIVSELKWLIVGGKIKEPEYCFFYTYEKWPPVPSRYVVNAIKKEYDLVLVVFWQELLSFKTVEQIYDKLHCQIQIIGVDYSQMAGGCHFVGDCERYKVGCGKCPAFHSRRGNDFTAYNVKYRKRFYDKVKPIVWTNLYMKKFYQESYLLRNARVVVGNAPIVDTEIFHPIEKSELRKKYNIPDVCSYIIFFGCQNLEDERKGIKFLLEALNVLYNKMHEDAEHVLVITAGDNFDAIKGSIYFKSRGMGYVPMKALPELFSLATCFVCPSVNDAGPMMVNQSLCCGTPVVGFDMGAVKQVVKDKGTGICVPLKDSHALAEGIWSIFKLSSEEYRLMSSRAREIGVQTSSYEAQADAFMNVFNNYRD